jgi:hypothetical protein
MKQLRLILALALPVAMFSCNKDAVNPNDLSVNVENGRAVTGNGAPSGAHYNLNIIGVPKGKTADMTGNNGGRIFVKLDGKSRIMLTPAPVGQSFQVLDANGTDGRAEFQLPKDVTARYRVFARVPGNQSGSATITTCAEYAWDGTEIDIALCSSVTMDRLNYSKFTDVSAELLYVTLTADVVNSEGVVVVKKGSYPLFDEALMGYFWEYDNNGLKILQLRFYEQ